MGQYVQDCPSQFGLFYLYHSSASSRTAPQHFWLQSIYINILCSRNPHLLNIPRHSRPYDKISFRLRHFHLSRFFQKPKKIVACRRCHVCISIHHLRCTDNCNSILFRNVFDIRFNYIRDTCVGSNFRLSFFSILFPRLLPSRHEPDKII